jgi:REP element-mobilizing transposase RayT
MSNHPRRYYGSNELHFITCSCYHRQAWLASPRRRDLFLAVFEQVRERYRFVVVGYVVMPDHIHLLISEPEKGDPSRVMQAIKQGFSRRVLKSVRKRRVAAQQELFAVGADEHARESSRHPTRETATGGASCVVLEYGWASPHKNW